MKTLCAWCKKTIKPEDGTGGLDSHGICQDCAKKEAPHLSIVPDPPPHKLGCGMSPMAALRFEAEWLKRGRHDNESRLRAAFLLE